MTTLKERAIARVVADNFLFYGCSHLPMQKNLGRRLHRLFTRTRWLARAFELLCSVFIRLLLGLLGLALGLIIALLIMVILTVAVILLLGPFPATSNQVMFFLQEQSFRHFLGWGLAWLCCAMAPYTIAGIPIHLAVRAAAGTAHFFQARATMRSVNWQNNNPRPCDKLSDNWSFLDNGPLPIVLRWLLGATGVVLTLINGIGGLFVIAIISLKIFSGTAVKETAVLVGMGIVVGSILISILVQTCKSVLGVRPAYRFFAELFKEADLRTAFNEVYRDNLFS